MKDLLQQFIRLVLRIVRPSAFAISNLNLNVDRAWYLKIYPDVRAKRIDPVKHFIRQGAWEGRRPNRFFDPIWYVQRHADAAGHLPILHYASQGRRRGLDPGPNFSAAEYYVAHPDVARNGMDALDHYILHGQFEQRAIFVPKFPVEFSVSRDFYYENDGFQKEFEESDFQDDVTLRIKNTLRNRDTKLEQS